MNDQRYVDKITDQMETSIIGTYRIRASIDEGKNKKRLFTLEIVYI